MNFIVCIISIVGIFLNCFIIFNSNNYIIVDNVDNVMCSNDEILVDKQG